MSSGVVRLGSVGVALGAALALWPAACTTGRETPPSPLAVISVTPGEGETAVAESTAITITFTVPVAPSSVTQTDQQG